MQDAHTLLAGCPCIRGASGHGTKKVKLELACMASCAAAPSFSVERSRERVQIRTGRKGPGQNLALAFAKHGGEAATRALAEKWLAA